MDGPVGKLARFEFIELKNAWERPVPLVSGMLVGIEDGTIQPTRARPMTSGLTSNATPSEISNSMRGVATVLWATTERREICAPASATF